MHSKSQVLNTQPPMGGTSDQPRIKRNRKNYAKCIKPKEDSIVVNYLLNYLMRKGFNIIQSISNLQSGMQVFYKEENGVAGTIIFRWHFIEGKCVWIVDILKKSPS